MIQPIRISIPPLENGDRLSREEFERRYEAMPNVKKAELIEGVVHMPSPVRHRNHGSPHFNLNGCFFTYANATPGVDGGDNSSLRLDLDNEPQPDGFLRYMDNGKSQIDEEDYIVGAPELIGEVSSSTVSIDLGPKLNVYRRNGVQEYVVWRVQDQVIDWFVLRGSQYERLPLGADGVYRSEVFPGLWLDPAALIRGDLATVLQVLQRGIAQRSQA
jgi:hypothetical protein